MQDEPFHCWKPCRHGTLLFNVHDRYVGRSLDLYGEFSEAEVELLRQLLRPGDGVVEVGANIGALTVPLARTVGSIGFVFAFEPQRLAFQALCANVALNSLAHVQCYQQAVGRRRGHVSVPCLDPRREANFGGVVLDGEGTQPGERVPVTILDAWDLPRCRLLKIDVEGMEQEVIQGARRLIARHCPFLYVENDRPDRSKALIRCIAELGYACYWHKPPLFNPNNYARNRRNVFGRLVSLNMLCVPRQASVMIEGLAPIHVPEGNSDLEANAGNSA